MADQFFTHAKPRTLARWVRHLCRMFRVASASPPVQPRPESVFLFEGFEPRLLLSADLAIGLTQAPNASAHAPGDTVSVGALVRNVGDQAAQAPILVNLYASTDGTLNQNDVLIGSTLVGNSLAPLKDKPITLQATLPQTLALGSYSLVAVVDPNHTIPDQDTSNNISVSATPITVAAPSLTAALANATGGPSNPGLTRDATISGQVTGLASLKVGLDNSNASQYTDITAQVGGNGSFTLNPAQLATLLPGQTLPDGTHTLYLIATYQTGASAVANVSFTLDTKAPTLPSFDLAATDQLGTQGNPLTQSAQATLVGSTQAGDKVTLLNTSQATVANTAGAFQFGNVALQEGVNNLAVQITDAAGNTSTFGLSVTRIAASSSGNAAIQWNQVILNAIETDASTPEYASRALAIESIAVMNAVNALNGTPGYLYNLTAPADANANAAVAQAAHDVLAWLYPAQASTFDAVLASTLSAIPNGQAKADGISLGSASAAKIIALRANDGYNTNIVDTGGTGVGIWQPTGPGFAPAQDPQWANLQTFALNSPSQFTSTLPGPPSLTSQAYANAVNQTESLGAANSSTRTADQTQIAKFWSDGQGTYTPPGAWNAIADQAAEAQGYSLAATAQLLGELNIAMADSAMAAWNVKYTDNTWRPITAIQNANSIGNSAITQDPSWQPLLITPNFPEYVSGHSTFSAAAAEVLDSFFGSNYAFSTTSSSLPGVTRSFTSFWAAANEAGMSRIYGGIHFSFSNTDGLALGTEVGDYVLKVFSQTQDTTPPRVVINQPSGFATNTHPTITGTVTDNLSGVAALSYTLDGGKAIAVSFNQDGSFQLPLNLALDGSADGQHTLVFTATDAAGNATAPLAYNFTLATQKPAISLDGNSIQNNGALAQGAQISGAIADKAAITGLGYRLDNGVITPVAFNASASNTTSFSQALNLSTLGTGSHTLTLTVTDAAGNSSTQTLNLTQPALALPTITSLTPMNGDSNVGVTQRSLIQFSRAIDPGTLTTGTFYATDSTGAAIPATIVMQQDNLGAWLFFTNPLPGASTVTLHLLGSQIKALADGTLLDAAGSGKAGTDYSETFTTVSTAPVPNTTLSGIIVDPGPDNTPMTPDDVKAGANGLGDYANDTWKLPIAGVKVYMGSE